MSRRFSSWIASWRHSDVDAQSDAMTVDSSVVSDIEPEIETEHTQATDTEKQEAYDAGARSEDVLIAFDGSGSTGGCNFYHDQTQRIVAEIPSNAKLLFWDHAHREITRSALATINRKRIGGGGTDTDQVAQYIRRHNFHGHLVIITDGEVDTSAIDACARTLGPEWRFEAVTAHLIGHQHSVNLSVTCPFTRISPHTIYTYYSHLGYERQLATDVSTADFAALEALDSIETLEDFEQQAAAIERTVVAQTMGTKGDAKLKEAVGKMKKRIFRSQVAKCGAAAEEEDEECVDGDAWQPRMNRWGAMCEGAIRTTFDVEEVSKATKSFAISKQAAPTATLTETLPAVGEEAVQMSAPSRFKRHL